MTPTIFVAGAVLAAGGLAATGQIIGLIAGVLTILSIVAVGFAWFHKVLSRIDRVLNAELTHNGGSSTKDMVKEALDAAKSANESAAAAKQAADHASARAESAVTKAETAVSVAVDSNTRVEEALTKIQTTLQSHDANVEQRLSDITPDAAN